MSEGKETNVDQYFDQYYPVIEKARKVKAYYAGKLDGQPRICSDVVGELITAIIKSDKQGKIVKDEDEPMPKLTEKQQKNYDKITKLARDLFNG